MNLSVSLLITAGTICGIHAGDIPRDSTVPVLDSILVRAPHGSEEQLTVGEHELLIGRSDDLNGLLRREPGVSGVPESASRMFVQGDHYFENRLLVRGVPLFSLAHFSGQTFSDRSFVPIGVDTKMNFHTGRLAGIYSGVSGSVLDINPQLAASRRGMPRPELRINFSTLGADLTFGLPIHRARQYYQLTWRPSDRYTIWMDDVAFKADPRVGYSQPSSYTDIQLLGRQRVRGCVIDELLWLARDEYTTDFNAQARGMSVVFDVEPVAFPWGVVSVSVADTASSPRWKLTLGGSRQYDFNGKRIGPQIPTTTVTRDNAVCTIDLPALHLPAGDLTARLSGEFIRWNGLLDVKQELVPAVIEDDHYSAPRDSTVYERGRDGTAGTISARLGWQHGRGVCAWGVDLLPGVFIAGTCPFIDPGMWFRWYNPRATIGLNGGLISVQPDIRGLASAEYLGTVDHVLRADLSATLYPVSWLTLQSVSYAKWRDHMPVATDSATRPVWDESAETQFSALGESITAEISLWRDRIRFRTTQEFSRTRLHQGNSTRIPEWDIPWTNKTSLAFAVLRRYLFVYLIGTFAEGLGSYDVHLVDGTLRWGDSLQRARAYRTVDLKIEWLQPIGRLERQVAQLDVYLLFSNVLNIANVREYYWDDDLTLLPINLQGRDYHVGVRMHLRF